MKKKIDPQEIVIRSYKDMTPEELIECCETHDLHHMEHHAREEKLLRALKKEHAAIDWLLARLITLDRNFRPSKAHIWPAIVNGSKVIREMTNGKL